MNSRPTSLDDFIANSKSASFKRLNAATPTAIPPSAPTLPGPTKLTGKPRIRQQSGPKLNKLETDFLAWLLERYPQEQIRAQAVTLVLANGVRYTPDFTNLKAGLAWETKGPYARDDAIVKIKVAAAVYPEIQFSLVSRSARVDRFATGGDAQWEIQKILP